MSRIAGPRLFFLAMPPPAWVDDTLVRLARLGVDKRLRSALFAPANWHQSFSERIFSPTEEECAALLQVGSAVSASACTLHFNRIDGSGDLPGRIHWTMRARGVPKPFAALLQEVRGRLCDAGFDRIATGVTPHMTLSYCARDTLDKIVLDPPIAWTIDELCLVIGGGDPYRYDVIGRWPLLPEIDPPATQSGLF
ncbi:2'-5' RNA ligase family protein [Dyella agri]|uniref:2'-5' RNA ligase n=1 Tax=Dyella agri TaxID=1926869 RepID=A0ABW8KDG6_9GAMM